MATPTSAPRATGLQGIIKEINLVGGEVAQACSRRYACSNPCQMHPSSVFVVAGVTIFLPYTALGGLFGLVPLPPGFMALLLSITALYLAASEVAKRWFYTRLASADEHARSSPA